MKLGIIAFTGRGGHLAKRLGVALTDLGHEARAYCFYKYAEACGLESVQSAKQWASEQFSRCDGLVFVSATGIAVRTIAPLVDSKRTDPAVVVIDERAFHVIPLLSGHLGGANDLARIIASVTGSDCVITTATDVNGVFAVDEWSKQQSCVLLEKEKIMHISSTLLSGGQISVYSQWPISGTVPEGIELFSPRITPYAYDAEEEPEESGGISTNDIDVSLDIEVVGRHPLHLVPRICVLGVGCRKGTSQQAIEEMLFDVLELTCVHPAAITAVASIDLKKDEPGLVSFCREHGWPLLTYSSEQLQQVKGEFTPSAFVASITGVDNVCERSAVLASDGELIQSKVSSGGVTMAMAMMPYEPDWTWRSEENE